MLLILHRERIQFVRIRKRVQFYDFTNSFPTKIPIIKPAKNPHNVKMETSGKIT